MRLPLFCLLTLCLFAACRDADEPPSGPMPDGFGDFIEADFPFISTTVDADTLGESVPQRNLTVRGVIVQLGNDAYAVFDPDLLRLSAAWQGREALELRAMQHVSYHEPGNKRNDIPRLTTTPIIATGIYPGWMGARPDFRDPRPPGANPMEVGRGPIAEEMGRWNGVYLADDQAVLAYTVQGTDVYEQPGSVPVGDGVAITRTFEPGPVETPLTLVVAEVPNATGHTVEGQTLVVNQGEETMTVVGAVEAPDGAAFELMEGRYITYRIPAGSAPGRFKLVAWKGAPADRAAFDEALRGPVEWADFETGSPARWPEPVTTEGIVAPDTAALVVDHLPLPLPNPWRRNVRVGDVDFFDDGRAALVTYDGDVWLVSGIDDDIDDLTWKRFASGLNETMSLDIVDGSIYTFGRDQITRLHDLNGDDEADFYENFSNLAIQTNESREYPLDMVAKPGGGFYLAKGGATDNGPQTSPRVMPGFRAGGPHSGTVLDVAPDGRSIRVFASGFREPYLGVHPETGLVTASDQQGNFVPSTPIYVVREGGFYGVPATAQQPNPPDERPPLTWIPHRVDRSGAGQVWALTDQMGPLNGALVHISYGEPAIFRVFVGDDARQGGLVRVPIPFDLPVQKGAMHPVDGRLYLAGFQVWDSNAQVISGFVRVRHTEQTSTMPSGLQFGEPGVVLRFDTRLDPSAAVNATNYVVKRWEYQRTSQYGSGYFQPDGSPGLDSLYIPATFLSADEQAVFVSVPDLHEVMQMEVGYRLSTAEGEPVEGAVYFTVNEVEPLDLEAEGFEGVDLEALANAKPPPPPVSAEGEAPAAVASAERGERLYRQYGCMACHSIDGSTEGKTGPTFKGVYGTTRPLTDGGEAVVDHVYIRESILNPDAKVAEGFVVGMASYAGIMSDEDIESVALFIETLK